MRTPLLAVSVNKASSINYCKLVREDYAEGIVLVNERRLREVRVTEMVRAVPLAKTIRERKKKNSNALD